jgi:signal transduction histidine kinase
LELETKLKLKTKEQENLKLKLESLKEIESKSTMKNIVFVVLILLFSALIFAYFQFKTSQKLNLAFKKIQKLQKEREKFFTIIAHDLKSPISSFTGLDKTMEYLLKKGNFVGVRQVAQKIDTTGSHLSSLIENLLSWGLSKQNDLKVDFKKINFNKIFDELFPVYNDIANYKHVKLVKGKFQDNEIVADANSVRLIIRNLLDIAIKNSPSNTKIIIAFENNCFSIENETSNMDMAKINTIENLFSSNHAWELGQNGLGIGLIIIKQSVVKIGGKINISMNENKIIFKVQFIE